MWTIATPFINKPKIIPLWLESFEKLDFPRSEFKLLWVDMSGNPEITSLLKSYIKKHGKEFKSVEYIENPPKKEVTVSGFIIDPVDPLFMQKRKSVVETMNLINAHREGNMLLWEDDIIAPSYAWKTLKDVFDKSELFMGVTAVQYYRHDQREGQVLAWNWEVLATANGMSYTIVNIKEKEKGIEAIGAAASGFTLYRKEFLDWHTFSVKSNLSQDIMAGHAINGFGRFPFGDRTKLMMVWDLKLPHLGLDSKGEVKAYKSLIYGS